MSYSTMRLCASGGAYEAVPRPKLSLDLPALRARLESAGVPVVDARVMLLVTLERDVTVSRDGRILIKTRNAEEAGRIFHQLLERLGLPAETGTLEAPDPSPRAPAPPAGPPGRER